MQEFDHKKFRAENLNFIKSFPKAQVLCVGDIIVDNFIRGSVNRVSPEAPIPVLKYENKTVFLGGVGNTVRNLSHLGVQASLVSVVGSDGIGQNLKDLLRNLPVKTRHNLIRDSSRQTSQITRYICGSQPLLRMDQVDTHPLSSEIEHQVIEAVRNELPNVDGVIFCDYRKGVLTPRVLQTLIPEAREMGKQVLVDPKGKFYENYASAHLLSPNQQELEIVTGLPTKTDEEVITAAKTLLGEVSVEALLVTRGEIGMSLITRDGFQQHIPAAAKQVLQVCGAGDTVAAAFCAALSVGASYAAAMHLANAAAGIVVGKLDTAAVTSAELTEALFGGDSLGNGKVCSRAKAREMVALWRSKGYRIGFANGCFDVLHEGHLILFNQAKAACDRLIIAVNCDETVSKQKGPGRPIQSVQCRSGLIAALESTDLVVIFHEETPISLLEEFKPDLLAKGDDYTADSVPEGPTVRSYGGQIIIVARPIGCSSTALIQRAKNSG